MIGTFFSKARSKYDREFAADGRALNDKVRALGVASVKGILLHASDRPSGSFAGEATGTREGPSLIFGEASLPFLLE
jgi:hypothetical protein